VPASRQFSPVVLQHASHLSTVPNLFWKIKEFDVHGTVYRDKFPSNKNQLDALISQIYFGMKLYMFWTVLYPSSGVIHCIHSNGVCRIGFLTAC
jgi:hypothetical protein